MAGRYRLRSKIGGGVSPLWLAQDQLLEREVAVKRAVSSVGLSSKAVMDARWQAVREGRIAAQLDHDNVVAINDVAFADDEPWFVMEYLPSRSLAQILEVTERLSPLLVAQVGAQIADAMSTAHRAGILHREVKPGNIVVTTSARNSGRVKITDLGLAGICDIGSPGFLAPEVTRGEQPTAASDVYALGATLYAAAEGHPPHHATASSGSAADTAQRGAPIVMEHSGPIADMLGKMLATDPSERPTMAQTRNELAAIAAGKGGSTTFILTSPLQVPLGETPPWQRGATTSARQSLAASLPAQSINTRTAVARPAAHPLRVSTNYTSTSRAPQSAPLWSTPRPRITPQPIPRMIEEPQVVDADEQGEDGVGSTRQLSLIIALLLLGMAIGGSMIVAVIVSQI